VSSSLTILVTGATGNQGGAVARKLLERGHGVRAFSRFAGSLPTKELAAIGAEIAVGSFDDRASIERAAEGVDAVFAMGTPYEGGMKAEVRQGTNTFEAAKAAGVGHLVYSSVASADEETGIPHFETKAELERRLGTLGVPHTPSGVHGEPDLALDADRPPGRNACGATAARLPLPAGWR
jgi:uncharacterized protein YbjT (DUF2867 family)